MKRFGSWSAFVTATVLLLAALSFVRGAIETETEQFLAEGILRVFFRPMDPREAAGIGYALIAAISVIVAAILLLGGLKVWDSDRRLWGAPIILGGVLTLLLGLLLSLGVMMSPPPGRFGIIHPYVVAGAFMLALGPITTVGGVLAVIGAKRGTASGRLLSSKWSRLTALFGITAFLIVAGIIVVREPDAVTVRKALEDIAADRGDPEPLMVTYSDLHSLWGGFKLTIRGKGQVEFELSGEGGETVCPGPGEPQEVSRQGLVELAALLVRHTAWEQRAAYRTTFTTESRAYLTIEYRQASVEIWEWYGDLEENHRISEIVEFMNIIALQEPVLTHVLANKIHRLAVKIARTDDPSKRLELIGKALDTAHGIDHALRPIAQAQAKAGDIAGALDTAHSIDDAFSRAEALSEIGEEQAKAEDKAAARQSFAAAFDIAQSIEGDVCRARALSEIAEARAKTGDIEAARQTFATALDSAYSIEKNPARDQILWGISRAQFRAGVIAGALDSAHSIDDADRRASALRAIIEALPEIEDIAALRQLLARALDAARSIEDNALRANALSHVAQAQAKAGDIAGALDTARRIEQAYARVWALSSAAEAQAKAGDIAAARQTLAKALDVARSIEDNALRANALRPIAQAQAKAGDIASALDTAHGIDDALLRAGVLRDISTVATERNQE